jgi:hypothetical protein
MSVDDDDDSISEASEASVNNARSIPEFIDYAVCACSRDECLSSDLDVSESQHHCSTCTRKIGAFCLTEVQQTSASLIVCKICMSGIVYLFYL